VPAINYNSSGRRREVGNKKKVQCLPNLTICGSKCSLK
jgi:hypothetical protein